MWNFARASIIQRRRLAGFAALSATFIFAALETQPAAAADSYVYYLRSFGDWAVFCGTVSCGHEESSTYDNCTLSARSSGGQDADSQIEIARGPADNAAVTLRVRGALMPESLFYLRVGDKPPHQTTPNREGTGGWIGPEAKVIIAELDAGQRVVMRTFAGPPPTPRDAMFSLDGFSEAMADFAKKVGFEPSSQDTLPRMPPPPVAMEMDKTAADGGDQVAGEPTLQESEAASAVLPEPEVTAKQPSSAPDTAAGSSHGAVAILNEHIGRAQLTTNIVDREPVDELGQSVRAASSREDYVYFFTEVRALAGQTIVHRWEHGGSIVASVPFRIGGDRWRVYSRKSIAADQAGPWIVSAIGQDGNVLARAAFTVE